MIIRQIRSNKESFRTVRLKDGANVVLAERSDGSAKKDTRNGLGKSTLLAVIGYCLGGRKEGSLAKEELRGWSFSLDGEHEGRAFSVSRSTDEPGIVEVHPGAGPWRAAGAADATITGGSRIKVDDYKRILGHVMFGLDQGEARQSHHPTFRSLAAYSMRQGGGQGGYHSPFRIHPAQAAPDVKVSNAYLLGLNWRLVADIADANDRKKRLRALERETAGGMLTDTIGSAGDLEAVMVRLEDASQREEKAISEFKVHEKYSELEEEADGLTRDMHDLVNRRHMQAKTLERYREITRQESEVSPDIVLATYEESGVAFPESVRRRLEEAREFHRAIVRNRREFLGSEMDRLEAEVSEKGPRIAAMGRKRAGIMRVLETHGAIGELVEMQARHRETIERKSDVSSRLGTLREIARKSAAINAEMARLYETAESDFEAHRGERRDAILAFNRYSEMLYKAPGILSIGIEEGEYRFDVEIERSGSRGIGNMKIFCYDLALASLWAGRPRSPGFLAHDSEIFDGVDERQVALALQAAAGESKRLGFQYICAINSDAVPHGEFDGGFDFGSHVAATLTDRGDDGGLLGIRF